MGYRPIFTKATYVIAGIIPVNFLAEESKNVAEHDTSKEWRRQAN